MGIAFRKIRKKSKILGASNLILVIVGLAYDFDRLIKEMDKIAGRIDEKVIMQIGNAKNYEIKNAEYFRFSSREDIERLCEKARVVVCHAGIGSILTVIRHNKPIIVVPRKKIYGEAMDDHQIEISKEWGKEGKITVVYDIENLENEILNINSSKEKKFKNDNRLAISLKNYIDKLEQ